MNDKNLNILFEDEITNELYFSIKGMAEYFNISEDIIQKKLRQYKLRFIFSEDVDIFWNRITLRCFEKLVISLHIKKKKINDALEIYNNRQEEIYQSWENVKKELEAKKKSLGMRYYLDMQRNGNIW